MSNYDSHEQQILVAFGLRLKSYRLERNFSQEELAEFAGVHRTYIGSAERGERNVSLINLEKIAAALDISISQLVSDNTQ